MAPQNVHVLIPETCDYATLQRDFADVIKDLEMERLSWIIWVDSVSSQGSF